MPTGETQFSERGILRVEAVNASFDGRRRGPSIVANAPPYQRYEPVAVSKISKVNEGATSAVSDGWMSGGSLFTSVLAGTLLGLALDAWLNTAPWLVVTGIVAGSVSGFYRMWEHIGTPQGKQDIFDDR